MRCICSNYGCTQKLFKKSNQTFILLVSLILQWYRSVVASVGARPHGLAPGQRSFEKTSQRWQTVGYTVSDLTGQGIEPKTFRIDIDIFNTAL